MSTRYYKSTSVTNATFLYKKISDKKYFEMYVARENKWVDSVWTKIKNNKLITSIRGPFYTKVLKGIEIYVKPISKKELFLELL